MTTITLTAEDYLRATTFAEEVVAAKLKEEGHRRDNDQEIERWTTGALGEIALEKLFGFKILDTRVGHSNWFNVADIQKDGVKVGVKTVEGNSKAFVIHKRNSTGQIFVRIDHSRQEATVEGFATKKVLNDTNSHDITLIRSKKLVQKGTKTGLSASAELTPVTSWMDVLAEEINI